MAGAQEIIMAGKSPRSRRTTTDIKFHWFHAISPALPAQGRHGACAWRGACPEGRHRHRRVSAWRGHAWQQPELYNLDMQAGAPPDAFSGLPWARTGAFPHTTGRAWAADGFAWWKQRFAQMGHYFDAFRALTTSWDSSRIWSSSGACGVEGILGILRARAAVEAGRNFRRAEFTWSGRCG